MRPVSAGPELGWQDVLNIYRREMPAPARDGIPRPRGSADSDKIADDADEKRDVHGGCHGRGSCAERDGAEAILGLAKTSTVKVGSSEIDKIIPWQCVK